jgi:hypothetical protein
MLAFLPDSEVDIILEQPIAPMTLARQNGPMSDPRLGLGIADDRATIFTDPGVTVSLTSTIDARSIWFLLGRPRESKRRES